MRRQKKSKSAGRATGKRGGDSATTLFEPTAAPARVPLVDALRGSALIGMFAYHFSFDLNHFGLIRQNFYDDAFWIAARNIILGSFLAVAGVSLMLAARRQTRWPAYGRRLVVIAACAIVVSIGSYLMFPASWIYFGVLHFIFAASVIGLAFLRLARANLLIGAALIAVGVSFTSPLFDQPWLNWVGLMTHKPVTEDYVPLLPWFGVVLIGMYVGGRIAGARLTAAAPWRAAGPVGRSLVWAGRHSLAIYMVHQPLLIGLLYLLFGDRH